MAFCRTVEIDQQMPAIMRKAAAGGREADGIDGKSDRRLGLVDAPALRRLRLRIDAAQDTRQTDSTQPPRRVAICFHAAKIFMSSKSRRAREAPRQGASIPEQACSTQTREPNLSPGSCTEVTSPSRSLDHDAIKLERIMV
jgi:hypothetical protein